MAEPVTMKLRQPIQMGSETVAELVFQPVTGKSMRKLAFSAEFPLDAILELAGRLSGHASVVIDQLSGDDLAEVIALVSGFLPLGLGTGQTE